MSVDFRVYVFENKVTNKFYVGHTKQGEKLVDKVLGGSHGAANNKLGNACDIVVRKMIRCPSETAALGTWQRLRDRLDKYENSL